MGCSQSKVAEELEPGPKPLKKGDEAAAEEPGKGEQLAAPPPSSKRAGVRPAPLDTRSFFDEGSRVAELYSCGVVQKGQWPKNEKRFDDVTTLMATIFQVPVSLVSLVGDSQNYFKSVAGPFGCGADREGSFCDAIFIPPRHEVLVVENAPQDARFSANPFVTGPPGICFYAGAPLVSSNGRRLGSLCVIDLKPRRFSAGLLNTLTNFAELVVRELERDKVLPILEAQERERQQAAATPGAEQRESRAPGELLRQARNFSEGVALVDVTQPGWPLVYANDAFRAATAAGGAAAAAAEGKAAPALPEGAGLWQLFSPDGVGSAGNARQAAEMAVQARAPARLSVVNAATGKLQKIKLRPAATDQLQTRVLVGIPNFVVAHHDGSGLVPLTSSNSSTHSLVATGRNSTDFWFVVVTEQDSSILSSGSQNVSPQSSRSRAQSLSSSLTGGGLLTQGQVTPAAFKGVQLGPLLGSGGFGRVYRADLRGALVAVKVIESPEELLDAEGNPLGALREAVLSKELRHPNIVQTFEFAARKQKVRAKDGQQCYVQEVWIAQQYCNRGTLYDAIDRGWLRQSRSPLGAPSALPILQTACEIASALSYLHSKGIVHGDLTGRNVLLNSSTRDQRRFTALVCDFGLSQALQAANHTVSSFSYGTLSHQPPELLGQGLLSKAVDVYSFGVLLWEMWGGCRAWAGKSGAQIIAVVTTGSAQLELPADTTPPAYKALCDSCLSFNPTERPSISQVLQQLLAMTNKEQQG